MAKTKKHCMACETFLGKPFENVHKLIDYPARELGPVHRKYFHNPGQCLHILTLEYQDGLLLLQSFKAALIHIIQDKGYEAIGEIEGFLVDILYQKHSSLTQKLPTHYYDEIIDLIVTVCGSCYVNKAEKIVEIRTNQYFDVLLECSYNEGYDTNLFKKVERLPKYKGKPDLWHLAW